MDCNNFFEHAVILNKPNTTNIFGKQMLAAEEKDWLLRMIGVTPCP
jgi:hypothetical protein